VGEPGAPPVVEALAREHIVIRYDKLGCGTSDRARTGFTMESEVKVLESLVEQLELAWAALGSSNQTWITLTDAGAGR
jgi:hypothetical protein